MLRSSRNNTPAQSLEAAPAPSGSNTDQTVSASGDDSDVVRAVPAGIDASNGSEDESQSFTLGDGVTCLVSTHQLADDVGSGPSQIESGTIVALKQYTGPNTLESTGSGASVSDDIASYSFLAQGNPGSVPRSAPPKREHYKTPLFGLLCKYSCTASRH
jgi:hypothetical protein